MVQVLLQKILRLYIGFMPNFTELKQKHKHFFMRQRTGYRSRKPRQ
jgi:hypothetical protein